MAEQRTGEQLFADIRCRKNEIHGEENTMIYDARAELLDGNLSALTDDFRKVAVALWGYNADEYARELQLATSSLEKVAGYPIIYKLPSLRRHQVKRIHPKYVNPDTQSSWIMKVMSHDDDQYTTAVADEIKARGFIFPDFVGQLLVKTIVEVPEGEDQDDTHYDVVWSQRGTLADNRARANTDIDISVGSREVIGKLMALNQPVLWDEFENLPSRK